MVFKKSSSSPKPYLQLRIKKKKINKIREANDEDLLFKMKTYKSKLYEYPTVGLTIHWQF